MRQSIRKYSWTPACDIQLENSPWPPRATVNLKIILDTRVRQWIRKYSLTPSWTVNLKILLDICVTVTFCPQLVFPIGKLEQDKCVWNDYSLYVMSTVSNSGKSVNSVNSYSAVLPPSPMVFFLVEMWDIALYMVNQLVGSISAQQAQDWFNLKLNIITASQKEERSCLQIAKYLRQIYNFLRSSNKSM